MGIQEAHDLSDVQRFYIIMAPTSRKGAPLRLAAVGKKQLPKTGDRFWASIQGLADKVLHLLSHHVMQTLSLSKGLKSLS